MYCSHIDRLSESELFHILQYLSYPEVLKMLSTCKAFSQYIGNQQLSQVLLHQHFGVDAHKWPVGYQQYYSQVMKVVRSVNRKSKLYFKPTEKLLDQIMENLYKNYRLVLQQYKLEGLDRDVEFLTVKAISKLLKRNLPLGGACFYHAMSLYMMRKELPLSLNIGGLELYPYLTIGNQMVFADLQNTLGLGFQERYLVAAVSDKIVSLINIRESFVTKPGSLRKGPNFDFSYYDFYGTDSNQLQSDCTTRGIRIRAAARAIYDDERSTFEDKVFSYQIRISDAGCTPEGAKLLSRQWNITEYDENGNELNSEVIRGEGVIGLYPLIKKNCLDFQYESCTILSGRTGVMKGAFTFQDQKTKERFKAEVRPFKLNVAPDRFLQYNSETKTTKVLF